MNGAIDMLINSDNYSRIKKDMKIGIFNIDFEKMHGNENLLT